MTALDVDGAEPTLSTIECLILAQAVYEHGADAWQSVSKVLSNHPALARSNVFFSPQSCHQIYLRLMNEASLECSEANNAPHAPTNLKLAQRHYSARLLYLRDLIVVEEVRFKTLVTEIDEIRSGTWDDRIRSRLTGNNNANSNIVIVSHSPAEPVSEPQPSATNDLPSTNDQGVFTQVPEDSGGQINVVDDITPQLPITVTSDAPVDGQVVEAIPVIDDSVLEPAPADIIQTFEEITTSDDVGISDLENVQIHVEESAIPQEPEPKANGQSQQREGKRKITDSDNPDENTREKKRAREESAPPDTDEHASRQRSTANIELTQQTPPSVPNKRFQTVIGMLHSQISQHRNGNIFHNPIKNSEAPDYHDIIKRPMDLKTIKARVKDGIISNSLEFQRDVYLMFANAMMYNRPGSDIYHMAEEMMLESEVHINTFRQTEGFIRSTRS